MKEIKVKFGAVEKSIWAWKSPGKVLEICFWKRGRTLICYLKSAYLKSLHLNLRSDISFVFQAVERELAKRDTHTQAVMKSGQDLLESGHYSSDTIQSRMISIQNKWTNLQDVAGYRKKKIEENQKLQQFIAEYNDIMSWLDMMERIVANDDLGYDEASSDTLLKKHKVRFSS